MLPDAVSFRDHRPPEGVGSPPGSAKAPFLPASPPPVTPPVPSPRSEFKINAGAASPLPPPNAVLRSASPASLKNSPSLDSDNEEDELQGQTVVLHSGLTIDCASAAYGPRSPDDPETEDEFGYTSMKVTVFVDKRIYTTIKVQLRKNIIQLDRCRSRT